MSNSRLIFDIRFMESKYLILSLRRVRRFRLRYNYVLPLTVLFLFLPNYLKAQFSEPVFINRGDTVVEEQISEEQTRWRINDHTQIFRFNFRSEIWVPQEDYTLWRLGENSQIWTVPEAFRLWHSEEGLAVWQYNKKVKDWLRQGFAPKFQLGDSLDLWRINDTICFTVGKDGKQLWHVDPEVVYWEKEIIGNYNTWQLNDTASFWKVDSLQHVHLFQDSTQLWELDRDPRKLKISENTSIWTLLPNIEIWKAGKKINIWSLNKKRNEWQVNDTVKRYKKVNKQILWVINKNLKVMALGDSVQIWRRNKTEKVWALSPKIRVWHFEPPPPPSLPIDTITEIVEPEIVEKIKLLQLSKERKGWVIDDSTLIWQFAQRNELWQEVKKLQKWRVNDSTNVWSLFEDIQITRINNNYRFWKIDNKAKEWIELKKPKYWQINDSSQAWWLNAKLSITVFRDTLKAWEVNPNINIDIRNEKKSWILNDTSQYWELNDTSLLFTPHVDQGGEIWKSEQYMKLPVSDSVFFWRVNENLRISRLKDSLTVWELKNGWMAIDSVFNFELNDSTRIWMPDQDHQIWQGPNSTRFYKKNKASKVYRLRDSIRAWTFYRPPDAIQKKKPSKWKLNGHLRINTYQNQLRNWSRGGGESTVSFQSEARADLKYDQKYITWHTWTELKFGVTIPGERDMQISEDKIEIDTKLNIKSKKRWSYTAHGNLRSQFTEGRDYRRDLKVSDFLSPLYFNLGLGVDYQIKKLLSLYLSPLTAKLTYVNDTATVDQTRFGVDADSKLWNQTGAFLNGTLNMNLSRNIRLESRFSLFSNYFEQPENIDIDWFARLFLDVNKYISTEMSIRLIYDDDTQIPIFREINGERVRVGEGPRLQMQEIFKVGFQFRF